MSNIDWGRPEAQPAPRRSGNWLWMLLGFVILISLLNSRAPRPAPPDPASNPPVAERPVRPADASRPGAVQREGDWSLEEVPVAAGRPAGGETASTQSETRAKSAAPKKSSRGDWQIEEVPADGEPVGAEAAMRREGAPRPETRSTKSTKGDWSIENVPTKN